MPTIHNFESNKYQFMSNQEGKIRITNGIDVRWVTPAVARDASTLRQSGYYIQEAPKAEFKAKGTSAEEEVNPETEEVAQATDPNEDPFENKEPKGAKRGPKPKSN